MTKPSSSGSKFAPPPLFPSVQLARMIHQNLPHQPGGDSQEMRPVLPVHLRLVHQFKVDLIDQRGGLQGVALALHPHVVLGDAPQFPFNQRDQLVETIPVSGPPAEE